MNLDIRKKLRAPGAPLKKLPRLPGSQTALIVLMIFQAVHMVFPLAPAAGGKVGYLRSRALAPPPVYGDSIDRFRADARFADSRRVSPAGLGRHRVPEREVHARDL
jgi:hypothetical protein